MSDGCDCTELCSMGPTCPGGSLAGLPGSGCHRVTAPEPLVERLAEAIREGLRDHLAMRVDESVIAARALLPVVEQAKAEAWDEGATKASPHGGGYLRSLLIENPYRAALAPKDPA